MWPIAVLQGGGTDPLHPCLAVLLPSCARMQELGRAGALCPTDPPVLLQIYHGKIKSKTSEPILVGRNPRVEFVGSTTGKDNNISIVLKDVELSDAGRYTCHVLNPKEKKAHNATIFLTVVHKCKCCWGAVSAGLTVPGGALTRTPSTPPARQWRRQTTR